MTNLTTASHRALIAPLVVLGGIILLSAGCLSKQPAAPSAPAGTPNALSGPVTAVASPPPAVGAQNAPAPGSTFPVGQFTVTADRFQAQVIAADGVNIRSAPTVTPDNRIGSLPRGMLVQVVGTISNGQEAEPGNGTTWYFLGVAGTMPQFIYGAPGTIQPLTGSATPTIPTIIPTPPPPPPIPTFPPSSATP